MSAIAKLDQGDPKSAATAHRLVIEPGRADRQYWRDIWRYRELLLTLAWRNVSIRYKQTAVGIAWAVVRPILTTAIFVVIFSRIAGLPSDVPYPLLVLSGMLIWQMFSTGLSGASESLVGNANLVSKVYFPRLIVPLSALGVSLIDFLITLPILFGMMAWYGHAPTWRMALMPAVVALTLLGSMSVAVWLSALNVRYRDVKHALPFFIQFGVYVTPVGISLAVIRDRLGDFAWVVALNPATGLVEAFRWCVLGAAPGLTAQTLGVTLGVIAVLLATGVRYFRRTERTFADVI